LTLVSGPASLKGDMHDHITKELGQPKMQLELIVIIIKFIAHEDPYINSQLNINTLERNIQS